MKTEDITVVYEEINSNHQNDKKMAENAEKPITEMNTQEIEAYLARQREKDRKKREREEKAYIEGRDNNIVELVSEAIKISAVIEDFKKKASVIMDEQSKKLTEYGKLRKNSKGGFSITHSSNEFRVTRRRDTEPKWDERSDKGVALISDFLGDVVKKRDVKLFEILMDFLKKNEKGDLEYSRVMALLGHEDKWNDERWVEGLRLLKQSFSNVLKAYGFEFKYKPENGDKFKTINLNFSAV